jgi:hypothetical protein
MVQTLNSLLNPLIYLLQIGSSSNMSGLIELSGLSALREELVSALVVVVATPSFLVIVRQLADRARCLHGSAVRGVYQLGK